MSNLSEKVLVDVKAKKKKYIPEHKRPPIYATGEEIIRFDSGPCFKLGDLEKLGPSLIGLIDLGSIGSAGVPNLITGPLKFVDEIPADAKLNADGIRVLSISFDTYLSDLGFEPPADELNDFYIHGADRFIVRLVAAEGVYGESYIGYKPRSNMNVERWEQLISEGFYKEVDIEMSQSPNIQFYVSESGGNKGLEKQYIAGFDFTNGRRVKIRPSFYLTDPFTLKGVNKPDWDKQDESAQLFQYLYGRKLHSEFAVTRDYVLQSDAIFETFNAVLESASLACEFEGE